MKYIQDTGSGSMGCKGCCQRQNTKLNTYDWLCDIPESGEATDYVEVQFKNTRKGYYLNSTKIPLEKGDIVAVESSPGHDIGTVTLTGKLVLIQMKKNRVRTEGVEVKRVYRKAKPSDLEKCEEAKAKEHDTMIRARKIAESLQLQMKIGDVEYQGDGNKAIFYYIADDRVDFRELIKLLADAFKVRIEMKQIGVRQEAGRIGGIGPCGRELCCCKWMTSFVSVSTVAARYQDISLNPQKLAGQCAKLKCCLNYEIDAYMEAQKKFPAKEIHLETKDSTYYHFKTEVFKGLLTYSTSPNIAANLVTISAERAFEVISMNKKGNKPLNLQEEGKQTAAPEKDYQDILGQGSLTRFDHLKKKKKKKGKNPAGAATTTTTAEDRTPKVLEKRADRADRPNNNSNVAANHPEAKKGEGRPQNNRNRNKRRRNNNENPNRGQNNNANTNKKPE